VTEWQLFETGTVPEWTTPQWYSGRERAPHVEQSAHRGRLLLAADMATQAIHNDSTLKSLVDLGCGDGGLLALFQPLSFERDVPMWGYDLQESNVAPAVAERDVDVRYGDVVAGDIEWGDVAVTTEMLEHLLDPHEFVRRIAQHSRVIVASSPFTETDQSHYEFHVWAWDQAGYIALIEDAGFHVARHQTVDMFQVIMGVRR
jgi:2-polyprenyl-3-methyl-5-hydroxy-6-metoxy-1,4-benzoquinol methylase